MLNMNYRMMVGQAVGSTSVVDLDSIGCVRYRGTSFSIGGISLNSSCWNNVRKPYSNNGTTSFMALIVGSGTTNATQDDIALENEITTLTYLTGNLLNGTSDCLKMITATYKNNTSDVVTVSEVGITAQLCHETFYNCMLLGRVVLENQVVMNPGDMYTFTYVIE